VSAVNIDQWYVIYAQLLTEIYNHFLSFACIYNHPVYVCPRQDNQRVFGVSNYVGHLKQTKLLYHQQT